MSQQQTPQTDGRGHVHHELPSRRLPLAWLSFVSFAPSTALQQLLANRFEGAAAPISLALVQVKSYLTKQWGKILANHVSIQDFLFAKEVRCVFVSSAMCMLSLQSGGPLLSHPH